MRRMRARGLLPIAVLLVLIWLVLLPNIFVLADSVRGGGGLTLDHYRRFWESSAAPPSAAPSIGSVTRRSVVHRSAPSAAEASA